MSHKALAAIFKCGKERPKIAQLAKKKESILSLYQANLSLSRKKMSHAAT